MKNKYFLLGVSVVVLVLGILLLLSLGFVNLFTGRATSSLVDINISLGAGGAPTIQNVTTEAATLNLNLGPTVTYFIVNFTVNDSNGYDNIDTTTANVTLEKAGATPRYNVTCQRTATYWTHYANYSCKIPVYWYDLDGVWVVNVSISDLSSNVAVNFTSRVTIGTLTGFESGPGNITFSTLSAGTTNQTASNDPLLLNNTGNQNITQGNIAINASSLIGETNSNKAIYAANFTIGNITGSAAECDYHDSRYSTRINMTYGSFTNINNSVLPAGNYTINNGATGQEELYLCILEIGSELSQQYYSTNKSWTIKIA